MWIFTLTEEDHRDVDLRYADRDTAAAAFNELYRERPAAKVRNLREEPDDYVPIEERNASPELFPPGVTCRSQLSPR